MATNIWPKILPELTAEQKKINDDFVKLWHEKLESAKRYDLIESFNHNYPVRNSPEQFLTTLEIGAGLGKHLEYEKLNTEQKKNYTCLELRNNMADKILEKCPSVNVLVGDCQAALDFNEGYFDRILAIHVLEHLPNLPAAIKEMYRVCNKNKGIFSVVIPCEGGFVYSLARRVSAQRLFEKRYKQSYQWFIEREHINRPKEIMDELSKYFTITHRSFYPFGVPVIELNLCLGLTLKPNA